MLTPTTRMLTVAMVIATCLIELQCAKVKEEEEDEAEVVGIHDIEVISFQQTYNENGKLLVLMYRLDCDECGNVLETLTKLQGSPGLPRGLRFVKSFNNELVSKLGVEQFPSIVYLRDKSYAFYDGNYDANDLLEWIGLATKKIVQRLDDESYSLLVKKDAEDKTDDWLVGFYNEACKSVLPVLETFGVRGAGQVKVGKVKIPESPQLTYKFKVKSCPEIIFFKDGEMYRYQSPSLDSGSLKDFVRGSFKTVLPQEAARDAQVDSDFSTKNITDFIQTYAKGDNKHIVLAGVGVLATVLLVLVVVCCRSSKKNKRKKAKKQ